METIYFVNCTLTSLDETFGLHQGFHSQALMTWLKSPVELSNYERESTIFLQELLQLNVLGWNEQELSLHFIGPLFSLARISSQKYNLFANRQISAQVGDYWLTGKPDGFVASGYREPRLPYFVFAEYKKDKDPEGDPAAQAIAAMLAGQALNNDNKLMYGCYVVGENWRFMVLEGSEYTITPAYSALTDEVFEVLQALKTLKKIVESYLGM